MSTNLSKSDLVTRLKADAVENKFTLDGEYLVFDKSSNLQYQVLESFKLGELLTKNPVSKTRLNISLLAALNNIREALGRSVVIRASYRSPEYHLLNFGMSDSDLYTQGNALSLGIEPKYLNELVQAVKEKFKLGELGIYKWGVHIGWTTTPKEWDKRSDTSIKQQAKDLLSNDTMKNIGLIAAAAVAGWFFFLRKK